MDQKRKMSPEKVNKTKDVALSINSLPDEMIVEVFGYLTQNQLGQIARVCSRWNVLAKSPLLWRKGKVKIFCISDEERDTITKSFINGLPSNVTSIKLDFSTYGVLNFEELCVKLHENCPLLEELILTRCKISNILHEVINFCTQFLQGVKKLVFYNVGFSEYSRTVELKDNSKIEVLDLSDCCFYYSKKQFSKLLYLKELRLNNTKVNYDYFKDDPSFSNRLHVLDLGWSYFNARTFLAIKSHGHNLKELYLCNIPPKALYIDFNKLVFPQLKIICLFSPHFPEEGVISLIQSCPCLENVYVHKDVAKSFSAHPFVVANRNKSGIVKALGWGHNHNVDSLYN